jgi:hypothetical protein
MKISLSFGGVKEKRNFLSYSKINLSTLTLTFSNLLVIYFAVIENWNLATVLFIYWGQSVIIGVFNFVKILKLEKFSTEGFKINSRFVKPTRKTKIFTAFFFAFHYGLFHLVYFIFLLSDFYSIFHWNNLFFIFLSVGFFFVNHFISFLLNKKEDLKKEKNIGKVFSSPYVRIVPMHLVIVFGFLFGSRVLVFFLVLKTLADLVMHQREHA